MISATDEQKKILETVKNSTDNLLIAAFAGSGKTTTLQMIAEELSDKKGFYLAYKKSILEEARRKFPKNIICKTTHGLAFEVYARQYARKLSYKFTSSKIADFLDIESVSKTEYNVNLFANNVNIAACAKRIVNSFCYSIDKEIGYNHFPKYYMELLRNKYKKEITLEYDPRNYANPETFLEYYANYCTNVAKKLWEAMINSDNEIGITHDAYLKLYQLSKRKIRNVDFILIDESQDANPAVLDILDNQDIQRIYVGDQYQQIYRWRGSLNAMKEIEGSKLFLTQSFRFGGAVAEAGNRILKRLGETNLIKPNPLINSKIGQINKATRHTVICRTNASILRRCLEYARDKKKVNCTGNLNETLRDFESGYYLWKGKIEEVKSAKVLVYQTWENLVEEVSLTAEPDIKGIMNFIEDYEDETLDIIQRIESTVTRNEDDADVILTTAHKSKGMEWSQVKISNDFKPVKYCSVDELNLWYVSITRAIDLLDLTEIKDTPINSKNKLLTVELVPGTVWFSNLRSILKESQWGKIKRKTFAKAGYRCEICGGCGLKWPVECHEIWHYDDEKKIQTLSGLTALCPSCHEVKHIGFAEKRGRKDIAAKHLCKINNWSQKLTNTYIDEQFDKWRERSNYQWQLDISYLKDAFNIEINLHERKLEKRQSFSW